MNWGEHMILVGQANQLIWLSVKVEDWNKQSKITVEIYY